MNILITGNLSSLATTLVKELSKQKHRFVLVSNNADQLGFKTEGMIVHSIDPAGDIFRDAMSSYGFDVVIFISTREEQLLKENNFNTGHQLDGLWNTLELCKQEKPKYFFYVSSTEVYGDVEDPSEKTAPQPSSINGYTLLAGEQYCQRYHSEFGVHFTIVRLTNVYGPDEKSGLVYNLILACY